MQNCNLTRTLESVYQSKPSRVSCTVWLKLQRHKAIKCSHQREKLQRDNLLKKKKKKSLSCCPVASAAAAFWPFVIIAIRAKSARVRYAKWIARILKSFCKCRRAAGRLESARRWSSRVDTNFFSNRNKTRVSRGVSDHPFREPPPNKRTRCDFPNPRITSFLAQDAKVRIKKDVGVGNFRKFKSSLESRANL